MLVPTAHQKNLPLLEVWLGTSFTTDVDDNGIMGRKTGPRQEVLKKPRPVCQACPDHVMSSYQLWIAENDTLVPIPSPPHTHQSLLPGF